jgi:hypothetical protein
MTRIIAMMPVRNEDWILDRTIRTRCSFCDVILVANQRSTDETRVILKRHAPKVVVIDNADTSHSTKVRWHLLDAAREYQGNNFLILADADEIFTPNIMDENKLDDLVSIKPGTGVEVPWIQLWRSPFLWRNDHSIWSNRWQGVAFRDDRCMGYGEILRLNDHNGRIPVSCRIFRFSEVKLLHFQFVVFHRMLSKQRWYRAREALELSPKRAREINRYYCCTRDERHLHLDPIPPEWMDGWKNIGVDLGDFKEEPLYWYDVELLRYFAEKGTPYFAPIDLWDVDWEEKRKLAKEQGYDGIPDEPIGDPRSFEQRLYHTYLHRFFHTPPWRDASDLGKKLYRSFRIALRSTGLRRPHL